MYNVIKRLSLFVGYVYYKQVADKTSHVSIVNKVAIISFVTIVYPVPEVITLFSCSTQLSMKF